MTREELAKWNNKLYPKLKTSDGKYKYNVPEDLGADWFEEMCGIKSAPKYPDQCWSHIPTVWGGTVLTLIKNIKDKYPKVEFIQVKEKFCRLVIYYECVAHERDTIDSMIERCQDILRNQGVHP